MKYRVTLFLARATRWVLSFLARHASPDMEPYLRHAGLDVDYLLTHREPSGRTEAAGSAS